MARKKAIKEIIKRDFDINQHPHSVFLVGGYRVKKGQMNWILGKKPVRDTILYNVRFSPCKQSQRDGSIEPGVLPDYIILYDFTDISRRSFRLFECLSYQVCNNEDMINMKYPNPRGSYIVYKLGEEYETHNYNLKLIDNYARVKYPQIPTDSKKEGTNPYLVSGEDIIHAFNQDLPLPERIENIRIVDLFAGLGGFHHAFDRLGCEMGFNVNCVFASELRADLRHLYSQNYNVEFNSINSDITQLTDEQTILQMVPEHDILCAGFPCQPFSKAGKQQGFDDEEGRGILFNYIAEIVRVRRPKYLFLENVADLQTHDEGRTWNTIYERLTNDEALGGLNYDIQAKVISPHEYGYPQHRKRIYIVGVDRNRGTLENFSFPARPTSATCDIKAIMERIPTNPQPLNEDQRHYIEVWQQFLHLCTENNAELPQAPIWAMEFGATYEYEDVAPQYQEIGQLKGKRGKFGQVITGETQQDCLSCLPNYAQVNKRNKDSESKSFPDWKIKFIRQNRIFYENNRGWIDQWKEQIVNWDNSFIKFEWNCDETGNLDIYDKILQFRPSGLRVKRPTYSPALTYTSSQVPIFPNATYHDEQGNLIQGRFMTMTEAARVQGMGALSFEGLTKSRIYEALGNAVDVEIIKIIAKNLIKTVNI